MNNKTKHRNNDEPEGNDCTKKTMPLTAAIASPSSNPRTNDSNAWSSLDKLQERESVREKTKRIQKVLVSITVVSVNKC